MKIDESIVMLKLFQGNIDSEIKNQLEQATAIFEPYINKIIVVTPIKGKAFHGLVTTPCVDYNGQDIRLKLHHYNNINYRVEKRSRVIPVTNILDIKIVAEFRPTTII